MPRSERPRAAIWARVSSDAQEDNYSLPSQLEACRAFCAENGWDVVAEYRVVHSIAYLAVIPEWQALAASIERGEIDKFVALVFNRVTGNQWDTGTMLRHCQHYGVEVEFVEEQAGKGEHADIVNFMNGWAAYKRREAINEATQRGKRTKMRGINGSDPRPLGCQREPFGMRYVEEFEPKRGGMMPMKRRFEPDPETADTLRSIFRWYDDGLSLRAIGRRLHELGIRTPQGIDAPWSTATLRAILTNENYVGRGWAGVTGPGKKRKPREEWIALPEGTFPAMVDEAHFDRVQARLQQNRRESAPGNRQPVLGLLRRGLGACGHCGRGLTVSTWFGRPAYKCTSRERYGCPPFSASVADIDQQVWQFVEALFTRPGALEAKLFGEEQPDPSADLLPKLEERAKAIAKQRERVQRRLRDTDDDQLAEAYEADLRAILAEAREVEARRQAAGAQHEAWRIAQENRRSVLDEAAEIRGRLADLDFNGRRILLSRIRAEVRLSATDGGVPQWSITTAFAVGGWRSRASNEPWFPSPWNEIAPLTIEFDDDEPPTLNLFIPNRPHCRP